MDSVEGLKLRKQALKPIKTGRADDGEEMVEEQPLSPMARSFHKRDSNVYIITMIGLNSHAHPDVMKANLLHTLLKHPRFSSLQVMDEKKGEMKWVEAKNIDIDNHVIVPNLDPNINMDSSDKFVENYIANLSKTTIDMSQPLWDLHLLNLKTSEAEAVAIFRVHHSLGDGTSLMSLLLACTRKISDPKVVPTIPAIKKSNPAPKSHWFWLMFQLVWNTIIDVLMFVATVLFLKDTETALKGSVSVGSSPRRFVHRTVSLNDVNLVKNAMSTTINDVVLGATQAGLTRYLNRKYGEGKKDKGTTEKENNHLPKNIRLRATLFINLRPSAGIHALANMMEKGTKAKWGNQIGYVLFPFTIALQDNPLDYVRKAKAVMDRKKASLGAMYTFYITKLMLKFFDKVASFPTHTTMWYSNVVGPQEEISLFGYPVVYVAPSCYGQPNGLMINIVSYGNKMTLVLSVTESLIPDPHQLCDDLEESLKLIKDAVIARGLDR